MREGDINFMRILAEVSIRIEWLSGRCGGVGCEDAEVPGGAGMWAASSVVQSLQLTPLSEHYLGIRARPSSTAVSV